MWRALKLKNKPGNFKSVMWISFASDLWNDLKTRYSQRDVFRVGESKEEFNVIRHWKQKTAHHISTQGENEDSGADVELIDSGQDEKASTSVNHITSLATLTQPKGTFFIEDD
ncbi:hypothetical protein PIB30_022273 [Stylosanthes scabra]|uniref:Uncharacterized protein n=1 Tax=Stylosanthes scabra TaxID=79078 RepID=A0ABU6S9C3_9FABA|nr:hypothetical protein [Stylosanthes scabra]